MVNKKQQLGQFFTKNSDYILKYLSKYVKGKKVSDPFAGRGDLLAWAKKHGAKIVKGYDVDDRYIDNKNIFLNDSLSNPLKYDFVLTNPPYLYMDGIVWFDSGNYMSKKIRKVKGLALSALLLKDYIKSMLK